MREERAIGRLSQDDFDTLLALGNGLSVEREAEAWKEQQSIYDPSCYRDRYDIADLISTMERS